MAETASAPNNKSVSFGTKPQREPAGVDNAAPMKMPKKTMRKTAKRAIKRGLISEKAAKRHLSGV